VIPHDNAHLPVYALTDPGKGGKNNEDNYAVSAYQISESDPTPSLIAIIADGVGGHQAGEVAASIAVETISQIVAESDAEQPLVTLERAFFEANEAIFSQSSTNPAYTGMSTTTVCAWVIGERLYLASVGDSRIYLTRGDSISQLTVDHTWVQEAIESGVLTLEQARAHPNAHLIRRYLGSKQPAIPDFRLHLRQEESDKQALANQGMNLEPGDYLLLCSDGLTDLVSDVEIRDSLKDHALQEALEGLIELANTRGGHDNITIIGIHQPDKKLVAAAPKTRSRLSLYFLLLAFFVAVLVGGWVYWMYFRDEGPPIATISPNVTAGLSLPTVVPTIIPPTQGQTTPQITFELSPSPITSTSPEPGTPIQATYTPWPTSTSVP